MMDEVKVFCPICKKGKNTIWKGTIEEWKKELMKEIPPEWANYAHRHENAHGHKIIIEYPDGSKIPFKLESKG